MHNAGTLVAIVRYPLEKSLQLNIAVFGDVEKTRANHSERELMDVSFNVHYK